MYNISGQNDKKYKKLNKKLVYCESGNICFLIPFRHFVVIVSKTQQARGHIVFALQWLS